MPLRTVEECTYLLTRMEMMDVSVVIVVGVGYD